MSDTVQLDPFRVRQPVVDIARRGRRPGEELVLGAPHDPDRTGDSLSVEVVTLAERSLDHRAHTVATRTAADLVGDQLGRNVLEV